MLAAGEGGDRSFRWGAATSETAVVGSLARRSLTISRHRGVILQWGEARTTVGRRECADGPQSGALEKADATPALVGLLPDDGEVGALTPDLLRLR
jgi:hypothetical protein